MTVRDLFRWRAIVPLAVFLVLVLVASWLLLDVVVERGIEHTGAYIVGAKVDLESADVRPTAGSVRLTGLQVADPDHPMTNLLQADEIVADVRLAPLLKAKVLVDTIALRGVRFGTPRTESGALEHPREGSGAIYREVSSWADAVRVPSFSLEGLGQVANVQAISPDSLRTLDVARTTAARADSFAGDLRARVAALDPRPQVDSARALAQRLHGANPLRLGVSGVASLASSGRTTLTSLGSLHDRLASLETDARADLTQMNATVQSLQDAREQDYAWARGLLKLPSLDAPDISPGIFGQAAVTWVKPVLYWLQVAERYLPPGLDPRRMSGEGRARSAGTTVLYPEPDGLPKFLLAFGEATFAIGGTGGAAGSYVARLTGLTSAPALYGKPMELVAERAEAARGPARARVAAVLDHVKAPVRDSLDVLLDGIALPKLDLAPLGARLDLGQGSTTLQLQRAGDRLDARWTWRTANAQWTRLASAPANEQAPVGSRAWAEGLLWRTVSSLSRVEIAVRLTGDPHRPRIAVQSNVGDAVAASLKRELGQEITRQEARVRAQVDQLVADQTAQARAKADSLRTIVEREIVAQRAAVDSVRQDLEAQVRRLTPGGIRLPGTPR